MSRYRFRSVTWEVNHKESPLLAHLKERFPHVAPLQALYREECFPLVVEASTCNKATLGTAFDFMVRFRLQPNYRPEIVAEGLRLIDPQLVPPAAELTLLTELAAQDSDPLGLGTERPDVFARCMWALALCAEIYRRQELAGGSPLVPLISTHRFSVDELVALAPDDAVSQLLDLLQLAEERLLPSIGGSQDLALGPIFDGSRYCRGDADLIHDGQIIEIKTRAGKMSSRRGGYQDSLDRADVYQLLAYILFDHSDRYAIRSLAVYSARYGALVAWDLMEALETLAGGPVDLAEEREIVWRMLTHRG